MECSTQSQGSRDTALLRPLSACEDPAVVGGKAVGLCRLIRRGFRVPAGFCLTTHAYREGLQQAGLDPSEAWHAARRDSTHRSRILAECRDGVLALRLSDRVVQTVLAALRTLPATPEPQWAVRSSATAEDARIGSYAGLYTTVLGTPSRDIASAITRCWASLWTDAAFEYHLRVAHQGPVPSMAVIVQPMLAPRAAGVAYSCHPVTGRPDQVLINAVWGLAEPLVNGRTIPDQYVVHVGDQAEAPRMEERTVVHKPTMTRLQADGLRQTAVRETDQDEPVLQDRDTLLLANLVRDVARAFERPADVEWALDESGYWLLQARPIRDRPAAPTLSDHTSVWSRANFKETLPELPSPLALSFLCEFMEACILRRYRALGCTMPARSSCVRIIHGRPFINVTLFQSLVAQLGGNDALLIEQMGGDAAVPPPAVRRLPWWRLAVAGIQTEWQIRRAARLAPGWFAELRSLADRLTDISTTASGAESRLAELVETGSRLHQGDLTFGIVAGVAQGLQALQWLLHRGIGPGWRPLFNASLQGLGTVISARQILLLQRLAELARREPAVSVFFHQDPFVADRYRATLHGTQFLEAFDGYLAEYGHRAVGESDMMVPRFAEEPAYLLGIVRGHLLARPRESAEEVQRRQEAAHEEALQRIRRGLRWHFPLWLLVSWWHRRLARYLALREANRHHLMYLVAAIRRVLGQLGETLVAASRLDTAEDIFFLTADEVRTILVHPGRGYHAVVAARRRDRAASSDVTVPDVVLPGGLPAQTTPEDAGTLRGTPISAGWAEGPVRLVSGAADATRVTRGDILVMPVIDPGMTPLLGLAGGLIVEMGGTLSHGAIIAREYGLPAIVNVPQATRRLRDGEQVIVDATVGEVRRGRDR